MRIVITDDGFLWNTDNPFLERYRDNVLVVCLGGRKTTDKYECFVYPFMQNWLDGGYGIDSPRYKLLASKGEELNEILGHDDDIVFLADINPESLYPFCVIRGLNKYNRLHLFAIEPFCFQSKGMIKGYSKMLSDLSALDSFFYYDSNEKLKELDRDNTMKDVFDQIQDDIKGFLTFFLECVCHMEKTQQYYDFSIGEFVPMETVFGRKGKAEES